MFLNAFKKTLMKPRHYWSTENCPVSGATGPLMKLVESTTEGMHSHHSSGADQTTRVTWSISILKLVLKTNWNGSIKSALTGNIWSWSTSTFKGSLPINEYKPEGWGGEEFTTSWYLETGFEFRDSVFKRAWQEQLGCSQLSEKNLQPYGPDQLK